MRWHKLELQSTNGGGVMGPASTGPGKRWGHTCNSIGGGRYVYVFGGYGGDKRRSNKIYIFDTANRTWHEPVTNGNPPKPRDSHTCTAVEDNLFIFGGSDGVAPLGDLHIFETSSNTWSSPCIRGEGPKAREGHSAALVGKRIFIFGGYGTSNSSLQEYYDDLFILNTETLVWKWGETSGTPPATRDSHTCSSWKNKILVIGGDVLNGRDQSDVYVLDTDSLSWGKLNTSGQLPPRAGHTTVVLGKFLFVFGGFIEQNLYSDLYMLDLELRSWSKVTAAGEGPSARFSMAGDSLDPWNRGILFFFGGCDKEFNALGEMYYLMTGISIVPERDDRKVAKLSLGKRLKLMSQEQNIIPSYDSSQIRAETNVNVGQSVPATNIIQPKRQKISLHDYGTPPEKRAFHGKVLSCDSHSCTFETVIDGKPLRGMFIYAKTGDGSPMRKQGQVEVGGAKLQDDHRSNDYPESSMQEVIDDRQADNVPENSVFHNQQNQFTATSNLVNLEVVPNSIHSSVVPNMTVGNVNAINWIDTASKMPAEAARVTSHSAQDGRASTAHERSPSIEMFPDDCELLWKGSSTQSGSQGY